MRRWIAALISLAVAMRPLAGAQGMPAAAAHQSVASESAVAAPIHADCHKAQLKKAQEKTQDERQAAGAHCSKCKTGAGCGTCGMGSAPSVMSMLPAAVKSPIEGAVLADAALAALKPWSSRPPAPPPRV
jgi:hypothetical protein